MIEIKQYSQVDPKDLLNRSLDQNDEIESIVADILLQVRRAGDEALRAYCEKFDGVTLTCLEVSLQEIEDAYKATDPTFLETLQQAAENIRNFHRRQVRTNFMINDQQGVVLGQKITPLAKVGLYVPGGTASYPSTVLMDTIPAKIAGVEEVIMVTPPNKQGRVSSDILAAARIAGVDRVFMVGGAQAIAALAYGTQSIPKVDKIVGPGNIFVATAKRQVYGLVDIDMIAGPSEILILAEGNCDPAYVAADMLSQAEHDKLAAAILITDSMELGKAVRAELERQIPLLTRSEIARAAIDANGRIIIAENMHKAVEISNQIAPEHLEVCVDDPFALLGEIRNAGSIFLGKNVPEALGDYFAGPNHTLPTNGTARFSSPLSVDDFIKKSSYLYYSKDALEQVQERIVDFAKREGLQAHANSVAIRFGKEVKGE